MTKFLLSVVMVAGFALTTQAQEIKFTNIQDKTLEYGEVDQQGDGLRVIEFTNSGQAPLILSNVTASCGCTVPSFDKNPILPGKSGKIEVKYDTNRVGAINKTLTITSNDVSSPTTFVKVKGKVLAAPTVEQTIQTAVRQ